MYIVSHFGHWTVFWIGSVFCSMVLYAHRRHTSCIPKHQILHQIRSELGIVRGPEYSWPMYAVLGMSVKICEKFISSRNLYTNVPAIKFTDILVHILCSFLLLLATRRSFLISTHCYCKCLGTETPISGKKPFRIVRAYRKEPWKEIMFVLSGMPASATEQLVVFRAIVKNICIQNCHKSGDKSWYGMAWFYHLIFGKRICGTVFEYNRITEQPKFHQNYSQNDEIFTGHQ